MLIEYKIKFEKCGLTITQRVEPNGSVTPLPVSAPGDAAVAKHLGASFGASLAASKGGDSGEDPGPGGGGPGAAPLTILGPFIIHPYDSGEDPGPGGGPNGGASNSTKL